MALHASLVDGPDAVARAMGPFADRLRLGSAPLADGEEEHPAASFLDPATLQARLDLLHRRYPGGDRRAVASLWTKYYLAALLPGPIAAHAADMSLDAAAGATRIVLVDGLPAALRLPDPVVIDGDEAWARLFAGHVAPLFKTVRGLCGVSARVLWSNAGNVAAYVLGTLAHAGADGAALRVAAAYRSLFDRADLPWHAGPNPLRDPVTWIALDEPDLPARVHRRRLCCLRWRLGESYCYSCPRIGLDACKAILRAQPDP